MPLCFSLKKKKKKTLIFSLSKQPNLDLHAKPKINQFSQVQATSSKSQYEDKIAGLHQMDLTQNYNP